MVAGKSNQNYDKYVLEEQKSEIMTIACSFLENLSVYPNFSLPISGTNAQEVSL